MRILIDIGHPGHVHLLRNTYHQLIQNGHDIWVTVKDIPIAKDLLRKYNIKYIDLGGKRDSLIGKALTQIRFNIKIFKLVRKNQIEIGLGTSMTLAHISKLTKMKSIILDDDDDDVQPLFVKYAHPFADTILSPSSLIGHRKSKKTIFYSGFHELAYLHPKRFIPDVKVINKIGLKEGEIFFVLRFVSLKGHHDIGHKGISIDMKRQLINNLKSHGKIFITSEKPIEDEFEKYRLPVTPENIHSLLYYAKMLIGDSQTMTTEAAIIGTPSLKCNTFAGKLSVPNELEEKFNICHAYLPKNFNHLLERVEELLKKDDLQKIWKKRKNKLLEDKIDVTSFMVWFIENYPKSALNLIENPEYQNNFK